MTRSWASRPAVFPTTEPAARGSRRAPLRTIGETAMSYMLRAGVTFCRVGDRLVFLDLPRDRYFCLTPQTEQMFDRLIEDGDLTDREQTDLRALIDDGPLVEAEGSSRPLPCAAPCPPALSLLDQPSSASRMRATIEALIAHQAARVRLKLFGLDSVLRQTAARAKATSQTAETDAAARLVAAALARASLIVSARNQCLSISLAAMAMLHRRGVAATLVLGVKLRPFQAHCWVQTGADLVTDRVDVVRNFTPIRVV